MSTNKDEWTSVKAAAVEIFGPLAAKKIDADRAAYPTASPLEIVELVALELDEDPGEVVALASKLIQKAIAARSAALGPAPVQPTPATADPRKWVSRVKPLSFATPKGPV